MSVHAYNTLQLCKLDTQMLNPCEVQVSLSQNKYVAVLSSPVFTSPDILRIGKQKKKTTFCVRRTAYMEQSVRGKWVEVIHEQFLQGQVKIRRGVKWLLQQETGCLFSKQHLITLPASLLLLSLSFFPSALSHTINFTSLSIPKSSSFHAKARLVTSFFFFFFCMLSFLSILLRGASAFSPKYLLPSPWRHYMISEICAFPPLRHSELWFGTDESKKKKKKMSLLPEILRLRR